MTTDQKMLVLINSKKDQMMAHFRSHRKLLEQLAAFPKTGDIKYDLCIVMACHIMSEMCVEDYELEQLESTQ